jgi:hypothetical protein
MIVTSLVQSRAGDLQTTLSVVENTHAQGWHKTHFKIFFVLSYCLLMSFGVVTPSYVVYFTDSYLFES